MRDRKQLRQHIRAARDWLGEADDSLEHENDVRGNLRLMLAQAELQRAKESLPRTVWKKWGMGLLSLMTAVILFLGGLWLRTGVEGVSPAESPSASALVNPMGSEEKPATVTENVPMPVERREPDPPMSEESAVPAEPLGETALPMQEEIRPREAEKAPELPKEETVDAPRVPSKNMQKLMQSAGKVLREE